MPSPPVWLGAGRDAWLGEVEEWVSSVVLATDGGRVLAIESVKENPWGAVLRRPHAVGRSLLQGAGPVLRS